MLEKSMWNPYQCITQCKGDIISRAFKTANIIVFDPMKCRSVCPYKTSCCVDQFCSTCDTVCAKLELQILKVGRFSVGWFILAARLVFGCITRLRLNVDKNYIPGTNCELQSYNTVLPAKEPHDRFKNTTRALFKSQWWQYWTKVTTVPIN